MTDRRRFLTACAWSAVSLGFAPRLAFAAGGSQRRFVFIIQRGAADGLGIVAPTGDPDYAAARGALAEGLESGARLDPLFSLHPALVEAAALYRDQQALFVHAIASPYRERSHFDGQNVLETGGTAAYLLQDGWLNRLLGLLPANDSQALALAPSVPLALRGMQPVTSYAASALPEASDALRERVSQLYTSDAELADVWQKALTTRAMAGDAPRAGPRESGASIGALAARMLSEESGARIAMIETQGWDTHAGQNGRLAAPLRELDALLGALRQGLGTQWANTLVLVATEFGRTVEANGTGGTDHGTGAAAMLFGGTVRGGRILADWPGLRPTARYEGRDLQPTLALEALIAGAMAEQFSLDPVLTMATLFPGRETTRPMEGLLV